MAQAGSPSPAVVNETVLSGATGLSPKTAFSQPLAHHRCTTLCAWRSLASQMMQASTEVVYVPGAQSEEAGTLAGAIIARIREGLASTSAALVCGAARAAGQPICNASAALRCAMGIAVSMPPALGLVMVLVTHGALQQKVLPAASALDVTACQGCTQHFLSAQKSDVLLMSCSCHC